MSHLCHFWGSCPRLLERNLVEEAFVYGVGLYTRISTACDPCFLTATYNLSSSTEKNPVRTPLTRLLLRTPSSWCGSRCWKSETPPPLPTEKHPARPSPWRPTSHPPAPPLPQPTRC